MSWTSGLDGRRRVLPLRTVVGRSWLATLRPGFVFGRIREDEAIPWRPLLCFILAADFFDVFFHVYAVHHRWVFQFFPGDWLPLAFGWAFYDVNIWLLGFCFLAAVQRWQAGAVTTPMTLAFASLYLLGGITWIAWIADGFHWFFRIPPVELSFPALAWFQKPIFGYWLRLSHFVILPWASLALWHLLRDVLHCTGRAAYAACGVAVVLPLAGRLFITPLPNVIMNLLQSAFGWSPSAGWVVLATHGAMTVITSAALWRWLRCPPAEPDRRLSTLTLVRRTCRAVVAPHRVFRGIETRDTLSWWRAALTLFLVGVADILWHPYLANRTWIPHLFPGEWGLLTVGWGCFFVSEWLLGVLALVILQRFLYGSAWPLGALGVVSYCLVAGVWLIAMVFDSLHLMLRIPLREVHIAGLSGLKTVLFGYWLRISHVFIFPWVSASLWMVLRPEPGARSSSRRLLLGALAVGLPIIGRVVIEPLPNLPWHLLSHVAGAHPSRGWVVLITYLFVAALAAAALYRLSGHRRHPQKAILHAPVA